MFSVRLCSDRLPRFHALTFQSTAIPSPRFRSSLGPIPPPPPFPSLESPKDTVTAREWLSRFKSAKIPRELVEISFSRSSGPGGQNVNKVNTKATLRCSYTAPWIPLWSRDALRQSPHYISSSQSLLITSTLHRSQAQNIDDCLSKLHALVLSAASKPVKNEPSEEQKERVRALERADNARRKLTKDRRSDVKKSRAKSRDWD